MITLDKIIMRLKEAGLNPKSYDSKVWADCPAHDDGNRYLKFIEREKGLIMMCKGRCTKDQMRATVSNTLKLSPGDLVLKSKKTRQQDLSPKEAGNKTIFRASPEQYLKGKPGEYSVECINASDRQRKNGRYKITLVFRVISGKQEGSIVLLYMEQGGKNVWASSTYSKAVCIALDRDIQPNEVISPEKVFVGKKFIAYVGWRRRKPRGKNANKPDFLRVHRLLRLL